MIRKGAKYFGVKCNEIEVTKVVNNGDRIDVYFTKGFKKDVKFYKRATMAIKFIKESFYTSDENKEAFIKVIK